MFTPRRRTERILEAVALTTAALAALTFLVAAALRVAYPHEIEWLESEMLQHVVRVRAGLPLYAAPSAEFSPTIYPPVFAWLGAAMASIVGVGFQAPRLVSALATLATAALTALLATRLGQTWRAGAIAAALLLASYVPCGTVYDLARLDPLWALFLLAGCAAAARADSTRAAAAAGLLLGLANATKQPAGLFALVMTVALWRQSRKQGAALFAAWFVTCASFFGALHVASGGWSTTYIVWIPLAVKHLPGTFIHFLRDDLLRGYAPTVLLLTLWAVRNRATRGAAIPGRYWLGFAAAAFATLSMRTLQGGGANTLVPLVVFGALMTGAVAGRILTSADARGREALWVLLAIQFGCLLYNPFTAAPNREDRRRADALVERIRAIPGDVWIPSHTAYAHAAGKPFFVHRDPLLDLLYSGHEAFPADLLDRLERGEFSALILDGPFVEERLQAAVTAGYVEAGEIAEPPRPLAGYRTEPRWLYLPRPPRE